MQLQRTKKRSKIKTITRKKKAVYAQGSFLALHFSFYKLMTFLMMLSVTLLSMLMILLSTLSVI